MFKLTCFGFVLCLLAGCVATPNDSGLSKPEIKFPEMNIPELKKPEIEKPVIEPVIVDPFVNQAKKQKEKSVS